MSIRNSLFFSFLDRYSSLIISIGSSMLIARLLTPAEIGVFSVTVVLLTFVNTIRGMGAGQYLVQERDLTIDRIRAVWTVQLGLGLGLGAMLVAASHPVSLFYEEPRMRDIMLVVALNYAINPLGSLTQAWLSREMRFNSLALMRFTASLGGAAVAVWFAWKDYGPISLAFGSLSSTAINALVAIRFRPKHFPWLPGIKEIKRVFSFGSKLTGSTFIYDISVSAPELFLGKLQDVSAVGFYSRANGLVQMFYRLFVDAVGAVCLPWFAGKQREQGHIATLFIKATSYISAFGWSFCLALVFLAHPVVLVLYGDQWGQSVDLTRLLSVAMVFTVPTSLCSTMLLSVGAINTIVRVTALSAIVNVSFVALAASHGLVPFGFAMIASAAVMAWIWLRAVCKQLELPLWHLLASFRHSAIVALLAAIGPAVSMVVYGAYPEKLLMPLLTGGIGAVLGFVLGVVVARHPLQEEGRALWRKWRFMGS